MDQASLVPPVDAVQTILQGFVRELRHTSTLGEISIHTLSLPLGKQPLEATGTGKSATRRQTAHARCENTQVGD
jgi:hypothetical protein